MVVMLAAELMLRRGRRMMGSFIGDFLMADITDAPAAAATASRFLALPTALTHRGRRWPVDDTPLTARAVA